MCKSGDVVRRFTRRAEELRNIASNILDPDAKHAMLKWADDYDRLAQRAIEVGTFGMPRNPASESSDEVAHNCSL